MTASSLYNVIDRGFISNGVGPLAIAGLALTMPLMNLTAAFGSMIGAGASTMVSIRLGQGRREDATHILGNTFILNFIIGLSITILGLIFLKPLLYAFGASEDTIPYATDFMQIILVANLFIIFYRIKQRDASPAIKKAISLPIDWFCQSMSSSSFIFFFYWGIRESLGNAIAQQAASFGSCITLRIEQLHNSSQAPIN
jgi:Na+-driven multidrug efflux pump